MGFGDGGRFLTVYSLTDALTLAIFTASAQHAAVNFPQYQIMSYVPNMPLAAYQPAPTKKDGYTEQDLLAMLPPLDDDRLSAVSWHEPDAWWATAPLGR